MPPATRHSPTRQSWLDCRSLGRPGSRAGVAAPGVIRSTRAAALEARHRSLEVLLGVRHEHPGVMPTSDSCADPGVPLLWAEQRGQQIRNRVTNRLTRRANPASHNLGQDHENPANRHLGNQSEAPHNLQVRNPNVEGRALTINSCTSLLSTSRQRRRADAGGRSHLARQRDSRPSSSSRHRMGHAEVKSESRAAICSSSGTALGSFWTASSRVAGGAFGAA